VRKVDRARNIIAFLHHVATVLSALTGSKA
jgi:hypothetical protein